MRILLVDDEASVLQAHMAVLKTIPGHDVRVAANAAKAIEHAAVLGGVDLLISDVVMEPTDGFTLRDELRALHPEMRTVFISGYDLSDYAERVDGSDVLAKPVDADALRGVVAKVESGLNAASAEPPPAPPAPVVAVVAVAVAPAAPVIAPPAPVAPEIVPARETIEPQPQVAIPAPAR